MQETECFTFDDAQQEETEELQVELATEVATQDSSLPAEDREERKPKVKSGSSTGYYSRLRVTQMLQK